MDSSTNGDKQMTYAKKQKPTLKEILQPSLYSSNKNENIVKAFRELTEGQESFDKHNASVNRK